MKQLLKRLPRLRRPNMTSYKHDGNVGSQSEDPQEFIDHCANIALIYAHTVFMWNARRKVRRYIAITGAKLHA